jgi:hypothetical protein
MVGTCSISDITTPNYKLITVHKYVSLLIAILFLGVKLFAHPMPNSIVNLSVLESSISGEAKMPLVELKSAIGLGVHDRVNIDSSFFKDYFNKHIQAFSGQTKWATTIDTIQVTSDMDPVVGNYMEVLVHFELTPPDSKDLRSFTFNYDAIIHQVVTHQILVFVKQDWNNGIHDNDNAEQIGIIKMDIPTEKIFPLQVNLEQGSLWKGFTKMVDLGMEHIKEGTDHLLFLIALLLPAMLFVNGNHWGEYGGIKYSLSRLIKITTSFTIGHSITLLIGAMDWLRLPSQPVEIMIAVSILVSAIHAIRPLFPGKEIYVAAGFGLIHGLAFASALSNMNLGATTLALSILGFNIGIELMQLFIIAIIIPWLIIFSMTDMYKWFRVSGATLAAVAASAWIAERSSSKANFITDFITSAYPYALWCIIALAVISIMAYAWNNYDFKNRMFKVTNRAL